MALAIALTGGIIMMIAMAVFGMAIPTFINANERARGVARDQAEMDDTIIKTRIEVATITANATDTFVTARLDNSGLTKLFDYSSFTVICSYPTPSGGNGTSVEITEELAYAGVTLADPEAGMWAISSFEDDLRDPKILNPGESAYLRLALPGEIGSGTLTVTISADNGVTSSGSIGV
ncbi:MAG TPA: hypothetical protein VJP79_11520 [Nitrososphaera sp.]|nr:hypothetical protein [Nitrososphaera sp.]